MVLTLGSCYQDLLFVASRWCIKFNECLVEKIDILALFFFLFLLYRIVQNVRRCIVGRDQFWVNLLDRKLYFISRGAAVVSHQTII